MLSATPLPLLQGGSVQQLKSRGVALGCVRTLVVVAEERPRISLANSFTALFSPLGLSPRAVSTSFGCRQNIAICLQVTLVFAASLSLHLTDLPAPP